jgi:hypothetical protein
LGLNPEDAGVSAGTVFIAFAEVAKEFWEEFVGSLDVIKE